MTIPWGLESSDVCHLLSNAHGTATAGVAVTRLAVVAHVFVKVTLADHERRIARRKTASLMLRFLMS